MIKAVLVERESKNGNKYVCVELSITDKVKKYVFLTDAELELVRLSVNQK